MEAASSLGQWLCKAPEAITIPDGHTFWRLVALQMAMRHAHKDRDVDKLAKLVLEWFASEELKHASELKTSE